MVYWLYESRLKTRVRDNNRFDFNPVIVEDDLVISSWLISYSNYELIVLSNLVQSDLMS